LDSVRGVREGGLDRLGRLIYRRRRVVVAAWLAALLVLAPLAPRVQGALASGGFIAQGSEAVRAGDALQRWVPGRPQSVLVVVTPSGDVAALRRAVAPLHGFPHLVPSPGGAPITRSPRGDAAYALFRFDVDPDVSKTLVDAFRARLRPAPGQRLDVTGPAAIYKDIETATSDDLRRAETIGIPAALLVLVLAFGTAVAAAMPLAVGGIAVVSTLGVLYLVAQALPLSIFVLNIATMLGLGVGVDYALLAVSRFREELRDGRDVEQAVARTVATAGRAIAFSGLAVLIGLSGLLVFGLRVLSSMAVGGSLVVAASALAAVTLLPALLGIMGRRVERMPVLPAGMRRHERGGAGWATLADLVMRRPWAFIVATLAIVLLLAWPALSARIDVPRSEVLPPAYESRQGEQLLDSRFSEAALNPIVLAVRRGTDLRRLEARVAAVAGVARVVGPDQVPASRRSAYAGPGGSAVEVTPAMSPFSDAARRLVDRLRELPGHGSSFEVTGLTAGELDFLRQIEHRFPIAVALIFAVTYGVLFIAFRSLLLPLKAIVMNSFSIAASFGALVWVFQEGHGQALLDVTRLGYIESTLPVVIFCVLFGISMDYEVFMLSRIAEAYREGADTRAAVARGLVATGRIITSAAAIVVVIGLSFALTGVVIVKELGLGLALAVFIDATLIRCLLVPATMRVLGDWNWWPGGRRRKRISGAGSAP
jgi:putative drug exporter of the RND superfamily